MRCNMILLLLVNAIIVFSVDTAVASCREGWKNFEDSCYLFVDTAGIWNETKFFCETSGSKLAEIESEDENNFLKQELKTKHGTAYADELAYFIGATDEKVEGEFIWATTGEPLTYFNWNAPINPSNGKLSGNEPENCIEMLSTSIRAWEWNDIRCFWKRYFICEMPSQEPVVANRYC